MEVDGFEGLVQLQFEPTMTKRARE